MTMDHTPSILRRARERGPGALALRYLAFGAGAIARLLARHTP
jgi:hypothetical protein